MRVDEYAAVGLRGTCCGRGRPARGASEIPDISDDLADPRTRWGPGGRRFKSCLPMQWKPRVCGAFVLFGA